MICRVKLSKGKLKAVWLHTPSKTAWAVLHTQMRHKATLEDVFVVELDVPKRWLKRSGKKGLWTCSRLISWERVREVPKRATVYAVSPIGG